MTEMAKKIQSGLSHGTMRALLMVAIKIMDLPPSNPDFEKPMFLIGKALTGFRYRWSCPYLHSLQDSPGSTAQNSIYLFYAILSHVRNLAYRHDAYPLLYSRRGLSRPFYRSLLTIPDGVQKYDQERLLWIL
jgi:hypothetical protein